MSLVALTMGCAIKGHQYIWNTVRISNITYLHVIVERTVRGAPVREEAQAEEGG